MEEPLVSVIIPAYNASKTIIGCLDSVYEQTYRNLEVIVVDDGSKDDTLSILRQYAQEHNDLTFQIYSIPNSGPASARNYGIEHSKGEYIAFLDSDDQWNKTKIEKQIACFQKYPKVDLLGCGYSIGRKEGLNATGMKLISKRKLLLSNCFLTPCVLLKRSLFEKFSFATGRRFSEDYYLWLQIVCHNYQCAMLNEVLTYLCDKPSYGGAGLSAQLWKMEKGELQNYTLLFKQHLISLGEYLFIYVYSILKYCWRSLVTMVRRF